MHRVIRVQRGQQEQLVQREPKDHKVLPALQEQQVQLAHKVIRVQRVQPEQRAQQERRGHKV